MIRFGPWLIAVISIFGYAQNRISVSSKFGLGKVPAAGIK